MASVETKQTVIKAEVTLKLHLKVMMAAKKEKRKRKHEGYIKHINAC